MKYLLLFIFLLIGFNGFAQSETSQYESLCQQAQQSLRLSKMTAEELTRSIQLDDSYFMPQGQVSSITHFSYDTPKHKWVFNRDGDLLLDFNFGGETFKYRDLTQPMIDKEGPKGLVSHDASGNLIHQYVSSGKKHIETIKFNKQGRLAESKILLEAEGKESEKVYKYDKAGLLKETVTTSLTGQKTKTKFSYSDGKVLKVEVLGKNINYTYTSPDSIGHRDIVMNIGGAPIHTVTVDSIGNTLHNNFQTYQVDYVSAKAMIPRRLEDFLFQHYYQLHAAIDSISQKMWGNGYARNEKMQDLSRYPFLIGKRENRHIKDKPLAGTVTVPSISFGPSEEIYSNDTWTFHKVKMDEEIVIYFSSPLYLERAVTRMRATFKEATIAKDKEKSTVTISSDKSYIMVKQNKQTKEWEMG